MYTAAGKFVTSASSPYVCFATPFAPRLLQELTSWGPGDCKIFRLNKNKLYF